MVISIKQIKMGCEKVSDAIGVSDEEFAEGCRRLMLAHKTYGGIIERFGVDYPDLILAILGAKSKAEAIAIYMLKKGRETIEVEEAIALNILITSLMDMDSVKFAMGAAAACYRGAGRGAEPGTPSYIG